MADGQMASNWEIGLKNRRSLSGNWSEKQNYVSLAIQVLALGAVAVSVAPAYADDAAETCFPVYRRGGAEPREPHCHDVAARSPTDLSNFTCVQDDSLIDRYCKKECEIDPLEPVTDPDAIPFENGENPVREDKLTESMSEKLSCLRDAVAGKDGASLTVNSAWRPQSYQDHFWEIFDKSNKLNDLVDHQGAQECVQRRNEVDAHKKKHGIKGMVAKEKSNHTKGEAFDASWSGITNADMDELAKGCGLVRPWPGNDKPHFGHKPKDLQAGLTVRSEASLKTTKPTRPARTAKWTVSVDGVHRISDQGTKYAVYTFTVENIATSPIRGLTVGSDEPWKNFAPILADKKEVLVDAQVYQPDGFYGIVEWFEDTRFTRVRWDPIDYQGDVAILPGQKGVFTLSTRAGSLPDITKTVAALGLKTFKYIEPVLVQLQPEDQDKPTLETVIQTAPAQDRPGWLKVTSAHATTDGHDPHPEVLLTKVESNQYISPKDVEAVYGAETTTFYVKQKRGRTYTAFYKAIDASGNSVTRRTEFDAGN